LHYCCCLQLFALSLIVATLYYGGHLVVNDELTGGNLVSFILYQMELGFALEVSYRLYFLFTLLTLMINLLQSISYVYSGLMEAVGASEKVFEFIDRQPEIRNEGKLRPATLQGHLEFKDVVFAYPSRPTSQVLKVSLVYYASIL
jgi:ATP-binding cassette subfamily B (MDR/TAP) protein 9